MKRAQLQPAAKILILIASLLVFSPTIGVFLATEELEGRHGRELNPPPTTETLRNDPKSAIQAGKLWFQDRVGFGILAGDLYRWVKYFVLGDSPVPNVGRNGDYFFMLSKDPRIGPNEPGRFQYVCDSCPPTEEWPGILQRQSAAWGKIRSTLTSAGYKPGLLIIPTKKLVYPEKLPRSIPEHLRLACKAMMDPLAPASISAAENSDVVFALDEFIERKDEPHFYPPENYHCNGGSSLRAAALYFQQTRKSSPEFPEIQIQDWNADIGRVLGMQRVIKMQRANYATFNVKRSAALRKLVSTEVPRARNYQVFLREESRNNQTGLVLSNSFGLTLGEPLAMGFRKTFQINTNFFQKEDLGNVFNELLQAQPCDEIIFVIHEQAFHGHWLRHVADALDQFGVYPRTTPKATAEETSTANGGGGFEGIQKTEGVRFSPVFSGMLGDGWTNPKPTWVWSKSGVPCNIVFPSDIPDLEQGFEILIKGFAGGKHFGADARLAICGQPRHDILNRLRRGENVWVRIPSKAQCGSDVPLQIVVPQQPTALELGLGQDLRSLGICVMRIRTPS